MIDIERFLQLETRKVARIIREAGTKVCAFPFDGTRRWLLLESPDLQFATAIDVYIEKVCIAMVRAFGMVFDHGVETILAPMVGPDLFQRSQEYLGMAAKMLPLFGIGSIFRQFYDDKDVCVRFYGDYERYLSGTVCEGALGAFADATSETAQHQQRRLFWGIFGQDATARASAFAVRFHKEQGRLPTREEIIADYYGDLVGPAVDLYIGFGAPAVFDMPLLATENTGLYFTVSPSPYFDQDTLRHILHDHLYARPGEPDYDEIESDKDALGTFYRRNRTGVLGVGMRTKRGGLWLPTGSIIPLERLEARGGKT